MENLGENLLASIALLSVLERRCQLGGVVDEEGSQVVSQLGKGLSLLSDPARGEGANDAQQGLSRMNNENGTYIPWYTR